MTLSTVILRLDRRTQRITRRAWRDPILGSRVKPENDDFEGRSKNFQKLIPALLGP